MYYCLFRLAGRKELYTICRFLGSVLPDVYSFLERTDKHKIVWNKKGHSPKEVAFYLWIRIILICMLRP